jgi:pyruvate kinase
MDGAKNKLMGKSRQTKIIASIGPANSTPAMIRALAEAGVYMFRCNFSHMKHDEYAAIKRVVDKLNDRGGQQVMLMADLQGPRIRVGQLPSKGLFLKQAKKYNLVPRGQKLGRHDIPIDLPELYRYVKKGQPVLFANGLIETEVVDADDSRIVVKAVNNGVLQSRKSLNLPESAVNLELSDQDARDIKFVTEVGVDWIAASFVGVAKELKLVRKLVGDRPVKIMSKIERQRAVNNIDAIAQASDGMMIARGDLGVELPYEDIPAVQRDIIRIGHRYRRPVIVATHMLYSLVTSLSPTRAEVSDVAFALQFHADGLMLSDETSIGRDPLNTVTVLKKITDKYDKAGFNYFDS